MSLAGRHLWAFLVVPAQGRGCCHLTREPGDAAQHPRRTADSNGTRPVRGKETRKGNRVLYANEIRMALKGFYKDEGRVCHEWMFFLVPNRPLICPNT